MKRYEERTRPEEKYQAHVETVCDLCGATTDKGWQEDTFDVKEVNVSLKTGQNYPDNGWGWLTTIDICPACFTGKLIPWVEMQGGKPTKEEWEW